MRAFSVALAALIGRDAGSNEFAPDRKDRHEYEGFEYGPDLKG